MYQTRKECWVLEEGDDYNSFLSQSEKDELARDLRVLRKQVLVEVGDTR